MIEIKIEGIEEAKKFLDPKLIRKAVRRSCLRTMKSARTTISSRIREDYQIAKKNLDPNISVAAKDDLRVDMKVTGKNLPAEAFGTISWNRKWAGAKVKIKRGKKELLPHTFMIRKFGAGAYVRTGKERFPFRKIMGPSIRQLVGSTIGMGIIEDKVKADLQTNFSHEIEYRMTKGMTNE